MTQHYVGTKIVKAWPQDQARATPDGGSQTLPGYAVQYEDGYTSWSPAETFEKAYVALGHLDGLAPHLQRVVAERGQLLYRIAKLEAYLAGEASRNINFDDRLLLQEQRAVMVAYASILTSRLTRAGVLKRQEVARA